MDLEREGYGYKNSRLPKDRETNEAHGTNHQAGAGWPMLWASEGLTFGLRPSALGLRSTADSTRVLLTVKNYHLYEGRKWQKGGKGRKVRFPPFLPSDNLFTVST